MLIENDGRKIIGTWQHDSLNGLAKVITDKKS